MTGQPLVSVVIPAFNAAATLRETLESVYAQTYGNIEIVVVDDGSTDATAEILRANGSRLVALSQPNGGLANARNRGCSEAKGEFLALLDADDLCAPERIALQVESLRRYPEAVLCCSDFSAFGKHGQISGLFEKSYYAQIAGAPRGIRSFFANSDALELPGGSGSKNVEFQVGRVYCDLAFGNFIHPPTVMMRPEALRRAGMFDPASSHNSDWECFVRLSRFGSFIHISRALLAYRLSPSQMSLSAAGHATASLDLVRTADRIWRSDPDLMAAHPARMKRMQASFRAAAARSLAHRDKVSAARLLAESVWHGNTNTETFKIAAKIVLPNTLTGMIQGMRARST